MAFQRRILHHGPHPGGVPQLLSLSALRSCWFELHRQGGCGSAELVLDDAFDLRDAIEVGDWISFEAAPDDRWYLGRVEEIAAEIPATIRYRLEGMAIELNEVFPGGFGLSADGRAPHRYAATDLFSLDPDYPQETVDFAAAADEVVRLLITQYVTPVSHISYVPSLIETPTLASSVTSLKVRGEESIRSLLKDLAVRAQSAAWGVNARGEFFFLRPRTSLLARFSEQRDLTALAETRDFEYLFNRLLLTGDYVYDHPLTSADVARKVFRWRGNYFEPLSRAQFGDRRMKVWIPWIRTQADALSFAREFFRNYSQPSRRYFLETTARTELLCPWLGTASVVDRSGNELVRARVETLRVLFNHVPRFRLELGPEDPRTLWPEPPQDERRELPNQAVRAGGSVGLPSSLPGGGGGMSETLTSESTEGSGSDSDGSQGSSPDRSSGSSGDSSRGSSGVSGSDGDDVTWSWDSDHADSLGFSSSLVVDSGSGNSDGSSSFQSSGDGSLSSLPVISSSQGGGSSSGIDGTSSAGVIDSSDDSSAVSGLLSGSSHMEEH